jgi:hypothetical protein
MDDPFGPFLPYSCLIMRSLGRDLGLNGRCSSNEPRIRMESSHWCSLPSRNVDSDHLAARCIERINYPVHIDYAREANSWIAVSIDQQWTWIRHSCSGVNFPKLRHSPDNRPCAGTCGGRIICVKLAAQAKQAFVVNAVRACVRQGNEREWWNASRPNQRGCAAHGIHGIKILGKIRSIERRAELANDIGAFWIR